MSNHLSNISSRAVAKERTTNFKDTVDGPEPPEIADPYFDPYAEVEAGEDSWAYWEEGGEQFSQPDSTKLKYELRLGS